MIDNLIVLKSNGSDFIGSHAGSHLVPTDCGGRAKLVTFQLIIQSPQDGGHSLAL